MMPNTCRMIEKITSSNFHNFCIHEEVLWWLELWSCGILDTEELIALRETRQPSGVIKQCLECGIALSIQESLITWSFICSSKLAFVLGDFSFFLQIFIDLHNLAY